MLYSSDKESLKSKVQKMKQKSNYKVLSRYPNLQ